MLTQEQKILHHVVKSPFPILYSRLIYYHTIHQWFVRVAIFQKSFILIFGGSCGGLKSLRIWSLCLSRGEGIITSESGGFRRGFGFLRFRFLSSLGAAFFLLLLIFILLLFIFVLVLIFIFGGNFRFLLLWRFFSRRFYNLQNVQIKINSVNTTFKELKIYFIFKLIKVMKKF